MQTWDNFIRTEMQRDYFKKIIAYLKTEDYYPPSKDIFNALNIQAMKMLK